MELWLNDYILLALPTWHLPLSPWLRHCDAKASVRRSLLPTFPLSARWHLSIDSLGRGKAHHSTMQVVWEKPIITHCQVFLTIKYVLMQIIVTVLISCHCRDTNLKSSYLFFFTPQKALQFGNLFFVPQIANNENISTNFYDWSNFNPKSQSWTKHWI